MLPDNAYSRQDRIVQTGRDNSRAKLFHDPLRPCAGSFRRNAHSHAAPRAATEAEYHAASGLEALFGWLYLRGQNERIEELFAIILEENNASGRHTADGAAP